MSSAADFEAAVLAAADESQRVAYERYFPGRVGSPGIGDHWFAGVRMGTVFTLAKQYTDLDIAELELLLDSPVHEVRVGALKAMALSAAGKKVSRDRRAELVELYLSRHDRIDEWDLVDLAAAPVVGGWALAEDPALLLRLAGSTDRWERRTAAVGGFAFWRAGRLDEPYAVAERLAQDPEDTVQKGVGWLLRGLGDADPERLRAFLDRHQSAMPRLMLRAALEKLPAAERKARLAAR